jgi:hypothetical protein
MFCGFMILIQDLIKKSLMIVWLKQNQGDDDDLYSSTEKTENFFIYEKIK